MDPKLDPSAIEEAFRLVLDQAPIPCHQLDLEGTIIWVNQAECRTLGYRREEMIGQPVWAFIAGEEAAASRIALQRKLSGEQPLAPFLREYVTRDRRYLTFQIHDHVLSGPDGKVAGIRSALIDVTERITAERARRESERWLSTTLASLRDGVIAIDAVGLVKFLNPVAERLAGVPQEIAVGADVDEVIRVVGFDPIPEDSPQCLGAMLSRSLAQPWSSLAVLRSRFGSDNLVELNSAPIAFEDRVIGVVYTLRILDNRPKAWSEPVHGPEPR